MNDLKDFGFIRLTDSKSNRIIYINVNHIIAITDFYTKNTHDYSEINYSVGYYKVSENSFTIYRRILEVFEIKKQNKFNQIKNEL